MTVETIEKKARRLLQDTVEEYRWTSEEIRDALAEAVRTLNAVRPETRYVDGALTDGVELPASDDEKIDIHDRYEEALVYYVVHKCYLDDDSDTTNATLAADYLSKFNVKVQL
jgi:hypothetical protein